MASSRSLAEVIFTRKQTEGIDPTVNSDAQSKESVEKTLELGIPENVVWTRNFGNEMENLEVGGGVDPVFEAKAAVVNSAFQHIGMGKYQWKLFALCGFGWVASPQTPLQELG
jgi:hypothetical protein